MGRVTEYQFGVRDRWRRFLTAHIGGDGISLREVQRVHSAISGVSGDFRGELYRYLDGKQTVGTDRAFELGEALNKCGVDWSSGPVALMVAGHFYEAFAYLDLLTRVIDQQNDPCVPAWVFASGKCGELYSIVDVLREDDLKRAFGEGDERLLLSAEANHARKLCSKACASIKGEQRLEIWRLSQNNRTKPALSGFQKAQRIVAPPIARGDTVEDLEEDALALLDVAWLRRKCSVAVQKTFSILSPAHRLEEILAFYQGERA